MTARLRGALDVTESNWRLPECKKASETGKPQRNNMLETIAVILVILWLLGLVSGYTIGNFIHILLVVAIIVILIRLIRGRPPV